MSIKDRIKRLTNKQKLIIIFIFLGLTIFFSVGLPTMARIKNRVTLVDGQVWDGTVGDSYVSGNGTKDSPYIISSGNELAFFAESLKDTDYDNTFFELSNDIIINSGIFEYDNKLTYSLNDNKYFVKDYTKEYYANENLEGLIGNILTIDSFDGFKGTFDGNNYTIYGMYLSKENTDNLGIFTNLEGTIKNIYFENSFIYGGKTTGGLASNSNGAFIQNVLVNGYVIGDKTPSSKNLSLDIKNKDLTINSSLGGIIDYLVEVPIIGNNIVSTSITGNYEVVGCSDCLIYVNGNQVNNGSFNVDLGINLSQSVSVTTNSISDVIVKLTNLKYNVIYNYAISGGLVGVSNSTTINNSINKSYVYGYSVSSGLVGLNKSTLSINRSYNNGNINSNNVASGLIGGIENNLDVVNINNSYNTGLINSPLNAGLISDIYNSNSIILNKVFDSSSTNNVINSIINSSVSVTDSYYINGDVPVVNGVINGNFVKTTLDNLKSKDFLINNNYLEYVDLNEIKDDENKVWVYENKALPILYLDDYLDKEVTIYSSKYSWNSFSSELNEYNIINNISVSIKKDNQYSGDIKIYYYIHNSNVPLSYIDLNNINSWTEYKDIININDEGKYIIYSKIVDNNNNISYLNTDVLSLDLTKPVVNISLNDKIFNTFKENLDYIYINDNHVFNVSVSDNNDSNPSIYYYISKDKKSIDDLDSLGKNEWIKLENNIKLVDYGTYIIYTKAFDNSNNIEYVNTDYITYDGFNNTLLYLGKNKDSFKNSNNIIDSKSSVTLSYEFNSVNKNKVNFTHNIISNTLLPLGTKMTLIDKYTKKVYSYVIETIDDIYNYNNSCLTEGCIKTATYPFSLFKEVGTSQNIVFDESIYQNNTIKEEYNLIVDFSNASVVNNIIDLSLYLEIRDELNNTYVPTINSTIKTFSVYFNNSGTLELSSSNLPTINLNSNSVTEINFNTKYINKFINENIIYDTSIENKKLGLGIYITDEFGNIISKDNFNNMSFSIDNYYYTPDENNYIYINLSDTVTDISKSLKIETKVSSLSLNNGNYYIKMFNYTSYSNKYINDLVSNEIVFPLKVDGALKKEDYTFNVLMDEKDKIINKDDNIKIPINVIQNGNYLNPNIRVSLYRKNDLTAFNQNYTLININDYISNNFELVDNNVYYAFKNPISYDETENTYNKLNLSFKNNLDYTGYKLVFELYDGNNKISQVDKYFIVK